MSRKIVKRLRRINFAMSVYPFVPSTTFKKFRYFDKLCTNSSLHLKLAYKYYIVCIEINMIGLLCLQNVVFSVK